MSGVHILRGPSVRHDTGEQERKWCFNCRAHLDHRGVLFTDPPERMSPYDPVFAWACPRCDQDKTRLW